MIHGRKPKVLIGVPTYAGKNYCLDEFIESLWLLNKDGFSCHVLIVDNTDDGGANAKYIHELSGFETHHLDVTDAEYVNQRLERSHNFLRETALKSKADYLFHVESDLILPVNTLQLLYLTNERIVSANYSLHCGAVRYPIMHYSTDMLYLHMSRGKLLINPELCWRQTLRAGKQETSLCGLGVVLIHKAVLNISFRSDPLQSHSPDSFWATDVADAGYKIYVQNEAYAYHNNDIGWGKELGFTKHKPQTK
jgi:hypothetical protein